MRFSEAKTKDESDLVIKFKAAQQLSMPQAIDDVIDVLYANLGLNKPQALNNDAERAFMLNLLFTRNFPPINGKALKPFVAAQSFALFRLLPDFLRAKDKGMFTENDLQDMKEWEEAAQNFIKNGVLVKDTSQIYFWTGDNTTKVSAWSKEAFRMEFGQHPVEPLIPAKPLNPRDIKKA